ncbi:MAG: segregation/condensation protein A [Patescibacteria group bacterium]|jgi:segregation and condensation protein A|nr:segregation/condensation protein A [Patescibacteria group bacterium]
MYNIKVNEFEGPFDLLLRLIEKEKMDITDISLAKVTDEFVTYLTNAIEINWEELADFLDIASKLLLIKSKLLIPGSILEEEEGGDLVGQLKIYKEFHNASQKIGKIIAKGHYAFYRDKIPLNMIPQTSLNTKITVKMLERSFKNVLETILFQIKLAQKTIKHQVISLKEKINELFNLVSSSQRVILNNFIDQKEKIEKVVIFLALLDLVKRKMIIVDQNELFSEIIITKKEQEV